MQRILHGGQDAKIAFVEQAPAAERSFHAVDSGIGQLYISGELVRRSSRRSAGGRRIRMESMR